MDRQCYARRNALRTARIKSDSHLNRTAENAKDEFVMEKSVWFICLILGSLAVSFPSLAQTESE